MGDLRYDVDVERLTSNVPEVPMRPGATARWCADETYGDSRMKYARKHWDVYQAPPVGIQQGEAAYSSSQQVEVEKITP